MQLRGISSVTVGASALFHGAITKWSSTPHHWSIYLCLAGLVGLLTLTLRSEKYSRGEIRRPAEQDSRPEDFVRAPRHSQLG